MSPVPSPKSPDPSCDSINTLERKFIAYFVALADLVNLPKSFGEIYGLLYASEEPLTFDQVYNRLQISKGSASQGLRSLIALHAIKKEYIPGERKDHYSAEQSLKKLINGFLRDKIEPHLENGDARIEAMESTSESNQEFYKHQLKTLKTWNKKAKMILPMIKTIVS